jgi:hypothetical protein
MGLDAVDPTVAVREIPDGLLDLVLPVHVLDAVIIGEGPAEALRQGVARMSPIPSTVAPRSFRWTENRS